LVGDEVDKIHSYNFLDGTEWERNRDSNEPTPSDDTSPEEEDAAEEPAELAF
jgi:hypothetical protein